MIDILSKREAHLLRDTRYNAHD